jgi:hypothetical protein
MPKRELDETVGRLMLHLRDRHGMHIVACERCDGAGCDGCKFQGILGIDFDAGKDSACGPRCPATRLFPDGRN